mgnify:CR=1 FL=1
MRDFRWSEKREFSDSEGALGDAGLTLELAIGALVLGVNGWPGSGR